MRVVRKERPPRLAPLPRDGPRVGSPGAGEISQRPAERGKPVCENRRQQLWRRQGGKPRSDDGGVSGDTGDKFLDLFPGKPSPRPVEHRLLPPLGEAERFQQADGDDILGGELSWRDPEKAEFRRQGAQQRHRLVYSSAVRPRNFLRLFRQGGEEVGGPGRESQMPEETVGSKRLLPVDLRQFSPRQPSLHVHLEKAVLGVDESLREVEIVVVRGGDVGNAVPVPRDFDGGQKAGYGKGAFPLRNARPEEGGTGREQKGERDEEAQSLSSKHPGGPVPLSHRFPNTRALTFPRTFSKTSPV
jgi:hypothetical protein